MAEADFADFLTCTVCLDTLREPVTLGCHHSFCQSCLRDYWDHNKTKNCPVCKRKSSKELVFVNFALNELSISFRQKQNTGKTERDPEVPPLCSRHPEVPALFCKDEDRALCPVCEFFQHQSHTVVRIEEVQKEQMRSELETLSKQKQKLSAVETLYEDMTQHTETQVQQCERHIRALFSRLHQFLTQEETRALEDLRKEKQRQAHNMSPKLDKIREELATVETTIQELKELLQKDTETFLKHYNKTQSEAKDHSSQPESQPSTGFLLDQAKVLGNLGYRVWRRMRSEVSYSPVILDTNTADESLYLSEDLRGVRCGNSYQKVPDNPERITNGPTVLGAEGFISGSHQWDVEVGDHPDWVIGVAKESVQRKGKIQAGPKYGVWCFWHREGKYSNGRGEPVPVQKPPVKIRVKLDCDRGQVSFYDCDHMTHLYTHEHMFTEKLFPLFSVGRAGEARTKDIKISLTEGPS